MENGVFREGVAPFSTGKASASWWLAPFQKRGAFLLKKRDAFPAGGASVAIGDITLLNRRRRRRITGARLLGWKEILST
jgi:hypothetical protein